MRNPERLDGRHMPALRHTESRRRIGKWSRGLEKIFEDVIKEGVRVGEFRSDLDPNGTITIAKAPPTTVRRTTSHSS